MLAPICFLAVVFIILTIRSMYSFCQTDESFYAALINRVWNGEKMVLDEWNSTQFYVPLLLPFYGLFVSVNGATDGVILFLRLLYLAFAAITAGKVFLLIWRGTHSHIASAAVPAFVLLFCRGNIQGVSYYNLCMLCLVSGFCSLAGQAKGKRRSTIRLIWSGILFASAVLCNPFLSVFMIPIVLWTILNGRSRKAAVQVVSGMLLMALLYLVLLLKETGIRELLENLTHVLNSPEQSSVTGNLVIAFRQVISISRYVLIPAAGMSILMASRAREEIKRGCLFPYYLVQVVMLAWTAFRTISRTCCVVVIPMTVTALPFLLPLWKSGRKTPVFLYIIGVLAAAAYMMASNTGADAGTVGFCISAISALWMCEDYLSHTSGKEKMQALVFSLVAATVLLPMGCQRIIGVYRDAPLSELTVKLTQGPAKGLYTTSEHAEQYDSIYETIREFSAEYPDGKILYTKNLPWAYLAADYGYGTSSPWRTYTEDLEVYYSVNENHRPDYICILEENVGSWEKSPLNRNPANECPNAMEYSGEFWDHVKSTPILKKTEFMEIHDVQSIWNRRGEEEYGADHGRT